MKLICTDCGCEKIIKIGEDKYKCAFCKKENVVMYNERDYGVMIMELKRDFQKTLAERKTKNTETKQS